MRGWFKDGPRCKKVKSRITWFCPYESTDPQCCQYDEIKRRKRPVVVKKEKEDEETPD